MLGQKKLFRWKSPHINLGGWGPWPKESAVAGLRELCLGWFLSPRRFWG